MEDGQKKLPVLTKAYEISYALFRVGARLAQATFKEQIERQALALLEAAARGDSSGIGRTAEVIEYLVKFGGDVGILHQANVETLVSELGTLCALTPRHAETAASQKVFLEDIFQPQPQEPLFSKSEKSEAAPEPAIRKPAIRQSAMRQNGDKESGNAANRQTAIIDKIRQSGNCRLKDLQDLLPECSERTIRYDLQSLIEQNLVERVGMGGPSVFYRVR